MILRVVGLVMHIWCQNHQVSKVDGKHTHEKPRQNSGNECGDHALRKVAGSAVDFGGGQFGRACLVKITK